MKYGSKLALENEVEEALFKLIGDTEAGEFLHIPWTDVEGIVQAEARRIIKLVKEG